MKASKNDFDDDDDELSEEEDEEELDDDENDDVLPDPEDDDVINSASPSTSSPTVTVAVPSSSVSNAIVAVEPPISTSAITTTVITTSSAAAAAAAAAAATATTTPSPKRQRITIEPHVEEKKPQPIPIDDSRRLFQRLWTDEDEIELLQGFLDYTTSRGSTHHNDTALFYDQIKSKLQLDFNKNQLVEKLRRLKKKYRNVVGKISTGKEFSFKSPHDQATFEISRKIWSNSNINNNSNNRFAVVVDDSVFDDEDSKNPNLMERMRITTIAREEAEFVAKKVKIAGSERGEGE
ncbi:putative transcription factor [Quercus suber]|uniref:Transcription factor n=1 Tax=Quercus suber TaxID=58331 RepID=A0AAW0K0L9_QUESU